MRKIILPEDTRVPYNQELMCKLLDECYEIYRKHEVDYSCVQMTQQLIPELKGIINSEQDFIKRLAKNIQGRKIHKVCSFLEEQGQDFNKITKFSEDEFSSIFVTYFHFLRKLIKENIIL
jgi:transposase